MYKLYMVSCDDSLLHLKDLDEETVLEEEEKKVEMIKEILEDMDKQKIRGYDNVEIRKFGQVIERFSYRESLVDGSIHVSRTFQKVS